jgi:hypothetical protein
MEPGGEAARFCFGYNNSDESFAVIADMKSTSTQRDNDTRALIDAIYWHKVRRARERSPVEKLLDGPRLFDFGCEFMRSSIRAQYPDADESEVAKLLTERIQLGRRLERSR